MKHNVVVFPGALTPSEIMTAWKAGSDFVKVFPCSLLGGASYIKALKSPFPRHTIDRLRRRDSRERRRFHPGGSCWSGNWPGFDQSRGCPAA